MPNVRITLNPDAIITISNAEYIDLLRQGLIYSVEGGVPIDYPDFSPAQYAELGDPASPAGQALSATFASANMGYPVTLFAGIDATGATDCTDAINAGINALPPDVHTLYFPPGIYMAAIRVTKPNLTLTGSWDATIKTPNNATGHVNDAAIRVLADGVVIDGLQIDGNKANNSALDDFSLGRWADGIGIYASNATIRNNLIRDSIGHKIICWNEEFAPTGTPHGPRKNILIEANRISGIGQRAAIDLASTDVSEGAGVHSHIVVRNNFVTDMGCITHTAYDVLWEGNFVDAGLSIHTFSKRVSAVNNIIGAAGALETSNNCQDISFIGNAFNGTAVSSINIDRCTRFRVEGNQVIGTAGGQGVAVALSTDGTITGNYFYGVINHSITLAESTSGVLIANNKSVSPTQYHVNISTASSVTIRGNSFRAGAIGIAVTSGANSKILVESNDITDTTGNGVFVTATDAVVQANTIRSAGAHAIRVQGAGSRVIGNEVRDTVGIGIYLAAAVTGVAITDNRVVNATVALIAGIQPDTIVRRNIGYATEGRGTESFSDTVATKVITHGLGTTPTAVTVTPRGNANLWISARAASTFTVSRSSTAGALAFDWQAEV